MNRNIKSSIAVCGLAFALGLTAPMMAYAEEVDASQEPKDVAVAVVPSDPADDVAKPYSNERELGSSFDEPVAGVEESSEEQL